MTKKLLLFSSLFCFSFALYSQPANIYQPNGNTTNFGKVSSDSLNYYVVNYPALTLMKIDANNNASLVTTLSIDPFQTMVFNNGKGIFPVANGSPFKLFDGTTQTDITGSAMPMAGYTGDKVIALDYFHKGNFSYFRTSDKIYKSDFSSLASIQVLASKQSALASSPGISEMYHTHNSLIYQDVVASFGAFFYLMRIDLTTGNSSIIDSASAYYDYGTVFNNEFYYCTPYSPGSVGNSKIYKVSDAGAVTVLYTETAGNKHLIRIIGVTPNGVIALMSTVSAGAEYVSIAGGVATPLNFGTLSNSFPCGNVGAGSARTATSLVYFEALDTVYTVNSSNKALWVTDGTLAGTKKIVGGAPATFSISALSPQFYGSAENCGNDLYFVGQNGSNATRMIAVDGSTFAVQTFTYGIPSTQPSVRKTANGIVMIGSPFPTTSAEKAVYKASCSATIGINEATSTQSTVELFPNPNNGVLNVKLSTTSSPFKVSVYDILGELKYSTILYDQLTQLKLNLQPGIYFISLEGDGHKTTKKICIE